jgi:hypothetical protein
MHVRIRNIITCFIFHFRDDLQGEIHNNIIMFTPVLQCIGTQWSVENDTIIAASDKADSSSVISKITHLLFAIFT